jgi:hypothetical protein
MTILRIRKRAYNTLMTSFLSYKINYFPLGFIYLLLLLGASSLGTKPQEIIIYTWRISPGVHPTHKTGDILQV